MPKSTLRFENLRTHLLTNSSRFADADYLVGEFPYSINTFPLKGSIMLMMSEAWTQHSFDWFLCWETMWTSQTPACTEGRLQKEVEDAIKGRPHARGFPILHALFTPIPLVSFEHPSRTGTFGGRRPSAGDAFASQVSQNSNSKFRWDIAKLIFWQYPFSPLGKNESVNFSQKDSQIHESFCTVSSDGDLWRCEQNTLLQWQVPSTSARPSFQVIPTPAIQGLPCGETEHFVLQK